MRWYSSSVRIGSSIPTPVTDRSRRARTRELAVRREHREVELRVVERCLSESLSPLRTRCAFASGADGRPRRRAIHDREPVGRLRYGRMIGGGHPRVAAPLPGRLEVGVERASRATARRRRARAPRPTGDRRSTRARGATRSASADSRSSGTTITSQVQYCSQSVITTAPTGPSSSIQKVCSVRSDARGLRHHQWRSAASQSPAVGSASRTRCSSFVASAR